MQAPLHTEIIIKSQMFKQDIIPNGMKRQWAHDGSTSDHDTIQYLQNSNNSILLSFRDTHA